MRPLIAKINSARVAMLTFLIIAPEVALPGAN